MGASNYQWILYCFLTLNSWLFLTIQPVNPTESSCGIGTVPWEFGRTSQGLTEDWLEISQESMMRLTTIVNGRRPCHLSLYSHVPFVSEEEEWLTVSASLHKKKSAVYFSNNSYGWIKKNIIYFLKSIFTVVIVLTVNLSNIKRILFCKTILTVVIAFVITGSMQKGHI